MNTQKMVDTGAKRERVRLMMLQIESLRNSRDRLEVAPGNHQPALRMIREQLDELDRKVTELRQTELF